MKLFETVKTKFNDRKKYPTFLEMPNWLLIYFSITGFIITGYFGFILAETVPDFLRVANQISLFDRGWKGWFLMFVFSSLSIFTWLAGSVSRRCSNIYYERHIK